MEKLRTAVIGFGGMGRKYAQMIYEGKAAGMELVGICCRNEKGQSLIRENYPKVMVYRDVEDTFSHAGQLDAVIIVTPHDTHVSIGKQAFEMGLHVICDKPAGISTKEVRELIQAGNQAGRSLAMIFNTRAHAVYQKAKEMLVQGRLGQVTRAVWVCNTWFRTPAYHQSAPWRCTWSGEQGGLLINQCQHYLDIWQWLLGVPDQIDASIDYGKYHDITVDDSVDLRFFYKKGLKGNFLSASGEAPGVNRLEIWGTMGKISIEDNQRLFFDENVMSTTEFDSVNREIYGRLEHCLRQIPTEDAGEPYGVLFQNAVEHIRQGVPLIASGEDGLNTLLMANASYLSSWLHKVVELPIDDDLYVNMLEEKIRLEVK